MPGKQAGPRTALLETGGGEPAGAENANQSLLEIVRTPKASLVGEQRYVNLCDLPLKGHATPVGDTVPALAKDETRRRRRALKS